jgi:hypothetical protein
MIQRKARRRRLRESCAACQVIGELNPPRAGAQGLVRQMKPFRRLSRWIVLE